MPPRKIRIVCISDTHNAAPGEGYTLPKGDMLIHAGDMTNQGSLPETKKAVAWLEKAEFGVKVVVAGNHDLSLDEKYWIKYTEGWNVVPSSPQAEECRALIRNAKGITYLEHESATVEVCGFQMRVFGSPFSPDRGRQNWGFQYGEADGEDVWKAIPEGVDVVITHTPAKGHVDASKHWEEGGCGALKAKIRDVKPLLHVCGHCHEGRGAEVVEWNPEGEGEDLVVPWHDPGAGSKKQSLLDLTGSRNGFKVEPGRHTAVVNASIMKKSWGRGGKEFNKPIVVDIDVPSNQKEISQSE